MFCLSNRPLSLRSVAVDLRLLVTTGSVGTPLVSTKSSQPTKQHNPGAVRSSSPSLLVPRSPWTHSESATTQSQFVLGLRSVGGDSYLSLSRCWPSSSSCPLSCANQRSSQPLCCRRSPLQNHTRRPFPSTRLAPRRTAMAYSGQFSVDGIYDVIGSVERCRGSAAGHSHSPLGTVNLLDVASRYPPLMISEPSQPTYRVPRSHGSSVTYAHSTFDESFAASSMSTAPSSRGRPPVNQQRPPVPLPPDNGVFAPGSYADHDIATSPFESRRSLDRLPCEFHAWAGCPATFDLTDVSGWVEHIEKVHLRLCFPYLSLCWICNLQAPFQCGPEASVRECRAKYWERMHHIAGHFAAGEAFRSSIRPDFAFLDHVHVNGLISEAAFRAAQSKSEWAQGANMLENPSRASPRGSRRERGQAYGGSMGMSRQTVLHT